MQYLFPSRSGKIKSFCFLLSLYVFSGLAQPDRFPKLEYKESGQAIYLDSLGKPIGNLVFDGGQPFRDGLAIVYKSSENGNQTGVINSKGKLIVPFGLNYIQNAGKGFAIVAFETTQELYNQNGQTIYTCKKCAINSHADVNLFSVHPNPFMYRQGEKVPDSVMVFDNKGKEVFRKYGGSIERIIDKNLIGEKRSNLPFFYTNNGCIYNLSGKLMLDSLHGIHFTEGYAGVFRCGKQAILDTDLKQVIPFSAGYSALYKLNEHPVAGAVSAGKNGKYGIITLDQKIIVPFKYRYFLRFDGQAQLYSMNNEKGDSTWTFTLEGDTIFSPEYYIVDGLDPKKGNFIKHPLSQKTGFKIEGKVVIPPTYNFLIPQSKDSLLFMKDGAAGYISPSGKTLFTFPFACFGVSKFSNGKALCVVAFYKGKLLDNSGTNVSDSTELEYKYAWVNTAGKIINNGTYLSFGQYIKGKALVYDKQQYFMVDTNLNRVKAQGKYDYASYFDKGFVIVSQEGKKFGVIDSGGKIIVPVIYDEIATSSGNIYAQYDTRYNTGFTYFDQRGNEVPASFNMVIPQIHHGRVQVFKDENESYPELFKYTPGEGDEQGPFIPDSLSKWYRYNPELEPRELDEVHIPLDGNAVSMIPYREEQRFGFVNKENGSVIVKPMYEKVFAVYKEGAIVKSEYAYGFVNNRGELLYSGFQNLIKEGDVYHGINIMRDEKSTLPEELSPYVDNSFYNSSGKLLFSEKAHDQISFQFGDTLAYFRYGKSISIRGKSGKLWAKFRVNSKKVFMGIFDNALVYKTVENEKIFYSGYDVTGKVLYKFAIKDANIVGPYWISTDFYGFYTGSVGVRFIDGKGQLKPYGMDRAPEGLIWGDYFKKSGQLTVADLKTKKYGAIDRKGQVVVPFRYQSLSGFEKGYAIFLDSLHRYGMIDSVGKTVAYPLHPETIDLLQLLGESYTFKEGLRFEPEYCDYQVDSVNGVQSRKMWIGERDVAKAAYKQNSETESEMEPEMEMEESETFCFNYIDQQGKTVFTLSPVSIAGYFSDGLAPVLSKGKFGFIDKTGKLVIPYEYEVSLGGGYPMMFIQFPQFINGCAYIPSAGGYIDQKNKKYFLGEYHYKKDFSH